LPVLIHVADPLAFFRPADRHNERLEELHKHPSFSWRGKGMPEHDRLLAALESTVARHRATTWIAAHMASCCEDLGRLGAMLRDHPNLNVDTSARVGIWVASRAPLPHCSQITQAGFSLEPTSFLYDRARFAPIFDSSRRQTNASPIPLALYRPLAAGRSADLHSRTACFKRCTAPTRVG
jgi:hypothetical protein